MKKDGRSKFHLLRCVAHLRVAIWVFALNLLFLPQFVPYEDGATKYFSIYVNGTFIGATDHVDHIYDLYGEARRHLQENGWQGMLLMEFPDITCESRSLVMGTIDSDEVLVANMAACLSGSLVETLEPAYSIKVNETIVNVKDIEDVEGILNDAIDLYDSDNVFDIQLVQNNSRELNVMDASIVKNEDMAAQEEQETDLLPSAGAEKALQIEEADMEIQEKEGFDAYELGIVDVSFSEPIEIVEAYLPESVLVDRNTAGDLLTNNQETQQIYKVQAGDTLSEISLTVGLPLDEIIALNDALENENSNIYVDQELVITVPRPELAVIWTVEQHVSESYELPIEYVYNDSWYTNKSVTLQQPSAGYREAIALNTFSNDEMINQEILYQEVYQEAVAKIVEVGTIVPPTYIKPISGGRITSYFGRRTAPTAGASTYHRGVDWATPVGTAVYASSGGTVVQAGWGSGYGYVVYINHPDGRQTRYGHLSRIYVSVGQQVRQGQMIAASGNTGRSTGPHLHFEILINGVQVNPLNYLY
ncbi:MAG: peptidoglycan DD-metalloendopeptidase family protein [Lachnospiraceae bacterium]